MSNLTHRSICGKQGWLPANWDPVYITTDLIEPKVRKGHIDSDTIKRIMQLFNTNKIFIFQEVHVPHEILERCPIYIDGYPVYDAIMQDGSDLFTTDMDWEYNQEYGFLMGQATYYPNGDILVEEIG